MKVKLNAPFMVDNKPYPAGVQDVPENHLSIMKTLDIAGMPILTKEQTPLVSEAPKETTAPAK